MSATLLQGPRIPVRHAREVPQGGYVVQGFFHRRVAELEPLLHEMDAQHGLRCKGILAPAFVFRRVPSHRSGGGERLPSKMFVTFWCVPTSNDQKLQT